MCYEFVVQSTSTRAHTGIHYEIVCLPHEPDCDLKRSFEVFPAKKVSSFGSFQGVLVDSTDVSLWYKIGCLALQIPNISLARHAFEQVIYCKNRNFCMKFISLIS